MAGIPKGYQVRGGGMWLDLDYATIDLGRAGTDASAFEDGWAIHADEIGTGQTLEIGTGFASREIAEAELERLRQEVGR